MTKMSIWFMNDPTKLAILVMPFAEKTCCNNFIVIRLSSFFRSNVTDSKSCKNSSISLQFLDESQELWNKSKQTGLQSSEQSNIALKRYTIIFQNFLFLALTLNVRFRSLSKILIKDECRFLIKMFRFLDKSILNKSFFYTVRFIHMIIFHHFQSKPLEANKIPVRLPNDTSK